jgi:hypothetical protein
MTNTKNNEHNVFPPQNQGADETLDDHALNQAIEALEAQRRDARTAVEETVALIDEIFRQTRSQMIAAQAGPPADADKNAKLLRALHKRLGDLLALPSSLLETLRKDSEPLLPLSKQFALEAAKETDPEIKRQLLEISERLASRFAKCAEAERKMKRELQAHLEEIASIEDSFQKMITKCDGGQ